MAASLADPQQRQHDADNGADRRQTKGQQIPIGARGGAIIGQHEATALGGPQENSPRAGAACLLGS